MKRDVSDTSRDSAPVDSTVITNAVITHGLDAADGRRSDASISGGRPSSRRRLRDLLVLSDLLGLTVAWIIASLLPLQAGSFPLVSAERLGYLPFGVALTAIAIAGNKLYLARVCSVRAVETAALLRACFFAGLVQLLLGGHAGRPPAEVARVVCGQAMAFVFVRIGRASYRSALRRWRQKGRYTWPVVIVGTGAEGFELYRLLRNEPELGYEVRGVVGSADEVEQWNIAVPYLGPVSETVDAVRSVGGTGVIIGASSIDFHDLNDVVRSLLEAGLHVQVSGGLFGFSSNRLRANPIGREAAFYLEQVSLTGWQSRAKRTLDILLAGLLLLPAAPVMAIAALLVKRHDRGPVLFKQRRVGRDGEEFTIFKIRTMVVDAEKRLAELLADNERSGPLFKMADDPRFTPIGKLLDATSINELPQLFNVLKGDMSLVGPRPALKREVETFDERLLMRHRVRPGITGLWQVEGRDSPSFEDYERCDVFYVENWSVRLDLAIMLQTVGEVVRRAVGMARRSPPDAGSEPPASVLGPAADPGRPARRGGAAPGGDGPGDPPGSSAPGLEPGGPDTGGREPRGGRHAPGTAAFEAAGGSRAAARGAGPGALALRGDAPLSGPPSTASRAPRPVRRASPLSR